jgi:hypothetical protein
MWIRPFFVSPGLSAQGGSCLSYVNRTGLTVAPLARRANLISGYPGTDRMLARRKSNRIRYLNLRIPRVRPLGRRFPDLCPTRWTVVITRRPRPLTRLPYLDRKAVLVRPRVNIPFHIRPIPALTQRIADSSHGHSLSTDYVPRLLLAHPVLYLFDFLRAVPSAGSLLNGEILQTVC